MDNSKQIKAYLQANGKTHSWREIADMFNVQGTSKQKSDYVRRLSSRLPTPPGKGGRTFKVTLERDWIATPNQSTKWLDEAKGLVWDDALGDYQEFLAWKKGNTKTNKDGIHLLIGCMHCPFYNKLLLDKLLKFIKENNDKIIGFHILGDFMDMASLSPHHEEMINLSGLTLGQEYKIGNYVLDLFDQCLPKDCIKTYLGGNHEFWWDRYVANVRNYRVADSIPSPYDALKLESRGYQVKKNWKEDYFVVGKYQLIHGIYCTTNSAKTHVDRLRNSVAFAHTHRIGQHYDQDLHGINIGTMANIDSEAFNYLSRVERRTWKNGFGIINVSENHSQAEVIICENNCFFYGGKRY